MKQTPEQIRTIGMAVLKELGVAGMIRFLQLFDRGTGDWATERRAWARKMTLGEIRKAAAALPSRGRGSRTKSTRRRSIPPA